MQWCAVVCGGVRPTPCTCMYTCSRAHLHTTSVLCPHKSPNAREELDWQRVLQHDIHLRETESEPAPAFAGSLVHAHRARARARTRARSRACATCMHACARKHVRTWAHTFRVQFAPEKVLWPRFGRAAGGSNRGVTADFGHHHRDTRPSLTQWLWLSTPAMAGPLDGRIPPREGLHAAWRVSTIKCTGCGGSGAHLRP